MKKVFLMLAAVAAFAFTSCNNEMDGVVNGSNGGTEEVTLNVALDNGIKTKAGAPDLSGLDLRYKVAVYTGSTLFGTTKIQTNGTGGNAWEKNTTANQFTISIPKGTAYNIVVWVDYVTDHLNADLVWNTADLTAITLKTATSSGSPLICNDNQDAFTATVSVAAGGQVPAIITAKRPFAKLNIKALDANSWNGEFDYANSLPNAVTVDITYKNVPTTFSALTGATGTPGIIYARQGTASNTSGDIILAADSAYFSGLVFAPKNVQASAELYDIDMTLSMVTTNSGTINPATINLTNIPLNQNYRTNVRGNLFLNTGSFTITTDADWTDPDYNVNYDGLRVDPTTGKLIVQVTAAKDGKITLVLISGVIDAESQLDSTNPKTNPADVDRIIFIGILDEILDVPSIQTVFSAMATGSTLDLTQASAGTGVTLSTVFTGGTYTNGIYTKQ